MYLIRAIDLLLTEKGNYNVFNQANIIMLIQPSSRHKQI